MKKPPAFFKIFFIALFVYACSADKHNGPYAYIDVLPHAQETLQQPDTFSNQTSNESQRLVKEIVSYDLLEKTLKPFDEKEITAQNIKELLEAGVLENTNMVRIRFYCEREAFSRAFLDSLVQGYIDYRNDLLRRKNARKYDSMDLLLNHLGDTLRLYEDSLILGQKSENGFKHEVTGLEQRMKPFEARYNHLLEQKARILIAAASRFYHLQTMGPALYRSGKEKNL